jgi:hypothetical protein
MQHLKHDYRYDRKRDEAGMVTQKAAAADGYHEGRRKRNCMGLPFNGNAMPE